LLLFLRRSIEKLGRGATHDTLPMGGSGSIGRKPSVEQAQLLGVEQHIPHTALGENILVWFSRRE
jgi:hypothetical protein